MENENELSTEEELNEETEVEETETEETETEETETEENETEEESETVGHEDVLEKLDEIKECLEEVSEKLTTETRQQSFIEDRIENLTITDGLLLMILLVLLGYSLIKMLGGVLESCIRH